MSILVSCPRISPTFTYNAAGQLLTETDLLGNVTSYEYDHLGRLTCQTDANSDSTHYEYDWAGNLFRLTDPEGNATEWVNDGLKRRIQETNELGYARHFVYDAAGNLTEKTDRNGRVTEYSYDHLNRCTEERWMDGQTVVRTISTAYDSSGQVTAASDPAASYTYAYDDLGRVTSLTTQIDGLTPSVVFNQTYDATGNRTGLNASIGGVSDFANAYTYDSLHRLTRLEQSGQTGGNAVAEKRVDFAYDAEGLLQTVTRYANLAGAQTVAAAQYGHDQASRLTSLTYAKGLTTLASYSWTYDAASRVTQFGSSQDGIATYTYDSSGQIVDADYNYQDDEDYTYDDNGNRTNTGYSTRDNNQLLSDGTYRYEYDHEGNRTLRYVWTDADEDGQVDSGERSQITEYAWDYRNRLTTVTERATDGGDSTQVVTYGYDLNNRMVSRTLDSDGAGSSGSESTYYVYDGSQIALEFHGSAAANLDHRYLWGAKVDQVLADEDVDSLDTPGEVLWPLADNLGTVRDLAQYDSQTDTTTIANHRVYDAFGNLTSQTSAAVDHLFGFTGRPFDESTGLQNNLNRWYDPAAGRWISEDPISFTAGDTNLTRYVGNHPTDATDPTGLWTCWYCGAVYPDGVSGEPGPQAEQEKWEKQFRDWFDKYAKEQDERFKDYERKMEADTKEALDAIDQAMRGGTPPPVPSEGPAPTDYLAFARADNRSWYQRWWDVMKARWASGEPLISDPRGERQTEFGTIPNDSGKEDGFEYELWLLAGGAYHRVFGVGAMLEDGVRQGIDTLVDPLGATMRQQERLGQAIQSIPRLPEIWDGMSQAQREDIGISAALTLGIGSIGIPFPEGGLVDAGAEGYQSFQSQAERIMQEAYAGRGLTPNGTRVQVDPGVYGPIDLQDSTIIYREMELDSRQLSAVRPFNQVLSDTGGQPIRAVVGDQGTYLMQGNHRVFGALQDELSSVSGLRYTPEQWESFTGTVFDPARGTTTPGVR